MQRVSCYDHQEVIDKYKSCWVDRQDQDYKVVAAIVITCLRWELESIGIGNIEATQGQAQRRQVWIAWIGQIEWLGSARRNEPLRGGQLNLYSIKEDVLAPKKLDFWKITTELDQVIRRTTTNISRRAELTIAIGLLLWFKLLNSF